MIVNHRYKFVFLKTRKTAGTSVEICLSEFFGEGDIITPLFPEDEKTRQSLGFASPRNFLIPFHRYGRADWAHFLKTRNRMKLFNHIPARLARRYLGDAVWNGYFKFCFERNPFDKAISRYYWDIQSRDPQPSLAEFLRSDHRQPLSDWHIYTLDNRVAVDFVGRYESLAEDLNTIAKRLGLREGLVLPRAKANVRKDRRHYREVLGPEERVLVEQIWAREIDAFGYAF